MERTAAVAQVAAAGGLDGPKVSFLISRTRTSDPNPSVEFLRSGPTLSYHIFVFRFYEAAVRDLRQSAITGHPRVRS